MALRIMGSLINILLAHSIDNAYAWVVHTARATTLSTHRKFQERVRTGVRTGIRTGVKTGENLARELNGNGTGTGVPLNGPFMGIFFWRVLYIIRQAKIAMEEVEYIASVEVREA